MLIDCQDDSYKWAFISQNIYRQAKPLERQLDTFLNHRILIKISTKIFKQNFIFISLKNIGELKVIFLFQIISSDISGANITLWRHLYLHLKVSKLLNYKIAVN